MTKTENIIDCVTKVCHLNCGMCIKIKYCPLKKLALKILPKKEEENDIKR